MNIWSFPLAALMILSTGTPQQTTSASPCTSITIDNNLYTNTSLGFSFRFPQGWGTTTKGDVEPCQRSGGTLIRTTPSSSPNPELFAFFQDLHNAFLIQSAASWLKVYQSSMEEKKIEVSHPTREVTYGNTKFQRMDFRSKRSKNRSFQATVVTILNRNLIGFGAAGMSEAEIESVLKTLDSFKLQEGSS